MCSVDTLSVMSVVEPDHHEQWSVGLCVCSVDTLSVMSVVEPDHVERLQLMNADTSVDQADTGSDSVSLTSSSHIG